MNTNLRQSFDRHESLLAACRERLIGELEPVAGALASTVAAGGTIFAAGNGGSASDALHFVAELIGRFEAERAPIAAVALGVDAPTVSAISNDYDFSEAISRQLDGLASAGDLFLAISTSGNSPNILRAAETAKRLGCTVVSLTGADGALARQSDLSIEVPSTETPRVQEMHILCLHALASTLDVTDP